MPDGDGRFIGPVLRDTVVAGAYVAILSLPIAIAMLWLSRRYGSHSQLTERRLRVIREEWRRRFVKHQDEDATAGGD